MLFCDSLSSLLVFANKLSVYVVNSDEFRATYCIDMRLDIGHRPYFSDKELINVISVVDT